MGITYDKWAESPEGQAAIQAQLDRAQAALETHRARLKAEREQAHAEWRRQSLRREQENGLAKRLGPYSGRIDDAYTAELPLTLGWNSYEDGVSLAYVALGGVDVAPFLPPELLADIRRHIELEQDDEH